MEAAGIEPVSATAETTTTCGEGDHPRGTESGTPSARNPAPAGPAVDPALALVVNVWPALPETVRRQVLGIIREAEEGARKV
jgi:hypothetical protein